MSAIDKARSSLDIDNTRRIRSRRRLEAVEARLAQLRQILNHPHRRDLMTSSIGLGLGPDFDYASRTAQRLSKLVEAYRVKRGIEPSYPAPDPEYTILGHPQGNVDPGTGG